MPTLAPRASLREAYHFPWEPVNVRRWRMTLPWEFSFLEAAGLSSARYRHNSAYPRASVINSFASFDGSVWSQSTFVRSNRRPEIFYGYFQVCCLLRNVARWVLSALLPGKRAFLL